MPTRLNTSFAPLTDSDEFESMVRDICAFEWDDPNTQKFGRKGQKQYGVDIYGQPADLNGKYIAAQCKLRTKKAPLTKNEVQIEVDDAKNFPHRLETLIIVTDLPRDTHLQILIDQISESEIRNSGFRVIVWFWDDVTQRLAAYPKLMVKYYRDYFANLSTLPVVERLVDSPLKILSIKSDTSKDSQAEEQLKFRGIHIIARNSVTTITPPISQNDTLPDGLLFQYTILPVESGNSSLLKFANAIRVYEQQVENICPVFALLPVELLEQFRDCLESLGGDLQRINVLNNDLPRSEIADDIFKSIFDYGYMRRGSLATIDIAARSHSSKPSSTLLDIDWHTKLNINSFPTPNEWEDVFIPALKVVTSKIVGLGGKTRIQINSQLPLPAAFALGFLFNLRIARVGVWARRTGVSDFKQQFWLSDGHSANITCSSKWVKHPKDNSCSAIVELSTDVTIHKSVEIFTKETGLDADAWLQLNLDSNFLNIDESIAIAYSNFVGRSIRLLNAQGISDIHLFARIPSALAVLIGQRLQACGRVHLYWFDNPKYRFAFTLK